MLDYLYDCGSPLSLLLLVVIGLIIGVRNEKKGKRYK